MSIMYRVTSGPNLSHPHHQHHLKTCLIDLTMDIWLGVGAVIFDWTRTELTKIFNWMWSFTYLKACTIPTRRNKHTIIRFKTLFHRRHPLPVTQCLSSFSVFTSSHILQHIVHSRNVSDSFQRRQLPVSAFNQTNKQSIRMHFGVLW